MAESLLSRSPFTEENGRTRSAAEDSEPRGQVLLGRADPESKRRGALAHHGGHTPHLEK